MVKALQYSTLPVTDGAGTPEQIIIDDSMYGGRLTIQQGVYPNQTNIAAVQGTYSGFVGNPDGTRNSFYARIADAEARSAGISGCSRVAR